MQSLCPSYLCGKIPHYEGTKNTKETRGNIFTQETIMTKKIVKESSKKAVKKVVKKAPKKIVKKAAKKNVKKATVGKQDTTLPPIWEAAKSGHWDTVKDLLQRDPSLINVTGKYRGENKVSLLHFAVVRNPDIELLKYLVSLGANVNASFEVTIYNEKGRRACCLFTPSPLHLAVSDNRIEVLRFLVSNGADVHAKDRDGKTPLDVARSEEAKRILREAMGLE